MGSPAYHTRTPIVAAYTTRIEDIAAMDDDIDTLGNFQQAVQRKDQTTGYRFDLLEK